jgi:hypothetical protein
MVHCLVNVPHVLVSFTVTMKLLADAQVQGGALAVCLTDSNYTCGQHSSACCGYTRVAVGHGNLR